MNSSDVLAFDFRDMAASETQLLSEPRETIAFVRVRHHPAVLTIDVGHHVILPIEPGSPLAEIDSDKCPADDGDVGLTRPQQARAVEILGRIDSLRCIP